MVKLVRLGWLNICITAWPGYMEAATSLQSPHVIGSRGVTLCVPVQTRTCRFGLRLGVRVGAATRRLLLPQGLGCIDNGGSIPPLSITLYYVPRTYFCHILGQKAPIWKNLPKFISPKTKPKGPGFPRKALVDSVYDDCEPI